jgi:negative regulator of genetic competence, sporulation and motility
MSSVTVFSVGEKIRVTSNNTAKRGIISFQNTDGTYDIIYDSNSEGLQETDHESSECITALENFESLDLKTQKPSQIKDYGNVLFKLKDIAAAIQFYKSALNFILQKTKVYGS